MVPGGSLLTSILQSPFGRQIRSFNDGPPACTASLRVLGRGISYGMLYRGWNGARESDGLLEGYQDF